MSPRPAQAPEQVEAKKSAIVQATLDVIVARGPAAVRLGDVARAAGMSIGTVQYYFTTRDELLAQAFSIHTATVLRGIEELTGPGRGDRSRRAGSHLHEALAAVRRVGAHDQRARIWLELVTAARDDASLQNCVDAVFDGWRRLFERIIEDGVDSGEFGLVDLTAAEVVDSLIAIIDGFDLATVAGHGPDPRTMTRTLVETADRLLGVPKVR